MPTITKKICKKYTAYNTSTIRDKTGRLMFREKELEDRWIECVEEVLNRPPPEVAADIPPAEVDSEVKSLKKGNAPGLDNLGPELFNAHPVVAASILQQLFYEIWKGERILEEW
ncbi:hypothetical protein pdam_00016597 [Pocillopora damicornis]|uniref:Reverse transcriptase domain-containing protein n=1 Tax=Pocillopora damicornis TaxID=46731 RepID=A0A3M6T6Y7_POCDA|nr:hypothetical protein pdam_00016597 [Pocillopora damicornis]